MQPKPFNILTVKFQRNKCLNNVAAFVSSATAEAAVLIHLSISELFWVVLTGQMGQNCQIVGQKIQVM